MKMDDQVKVTDQQKTHLKEYVTNNSAILEGRFFGPLQRKQAELWKKLKNELNQSGAQLSVPEWKKVWWNMKKETKEKPSLDGAVPSDSGYPEDEDVMVVLEERKTKIEDANEVRNLESDGRNQKNNPRRGSDSNGTKRNRQSLSPVSSISSTFNSKLSSKSPPNICDIMNNKSHSGRSKSPSKSKRSPYKHVSNYHRKRDSYHSRHGKSRSPSSGRSRKPSHSRLRSKSKSREPSRKRYRSKSPAHSYKDKFSSEKKVWEIFRTEVDALEKERRANEQLYKKNPEKHPDYKTEWKKFYKSRVKELLDRGKDPKTYNFESEWAYFWKWKMDELLKTDFETKKDAIRKKLKLPEDDIKPHYKPIPNRTRDGVNDLQSSLTSGSPFDNTYHSYANTKMADSSTGLISTLRIVTAVEEQLGSLGPQVNGLLSQSVALNRVSGSNPDSLLSNPDNFVLLETVREKLMGQIQSKIVRRSLVGAVTEAIGSIDNLLKTVPSPDPVLSQNYISTSQPQRQQNDLSYAETVAQVNIPGMGHVDRVAIAQQIAEALVKQGKTDVTEAELQELVNAVLGMAKTQAIQEKSKETASIYGENLEGKATPTLSSSVPSEKFSNISQFNALEAFNSLANSGFSSQSTSLNKGKSAFELLMSVVQSSANKTNSAAMPSDYDSDKSDTESFINKISTKKFAGFKSVSKELKKNNSLENARQEGERNSEGAKIRPLLETYQRNVLSENRGMFKELPHKSLREDEKVNMSSRQTNRQLSPFSSRQESSNPRHSGLEVEDKHLNIIGAWDSDSDIDLDSSDKTKAPAYEKTIDTQISFDKNKKKPSALAKYIPPLLNADKNVSSSSKLSMVPNLNINRTIDDLMGSLNRRSSGNQQSSGGHIPLVDPSNKNFGQAKHASFSTAQQGGITNSNYGASYYQSGMSTQLAQPSAYGNISTPGYNAQHSQYTYGAQNASNYNSMTGANCNQYGVVSYPYNQSSSQSTAQTYYGGGEYGQINPQYQGYYTYPQNYSVNAGAHSTNYQQPYQ